MSKPKIVLWDLEVLRDNESITADVWFGMSNWPGRTLKGDINSICCFGYKYLGEGPAQSINAWDFPGWEYSVNDDGELVAAAYEILKEADGIITHNGASFDLKLFNTRLVKHGFPPLPKIPHMDTKLIAKRHLSVYSNSLNHLARFLGVETKIDTTAGLWDAVSARDNQAMNYMAEYCSQDVEVLDQVFNKLLPYVNNMPNYNMFTKKDRNVCPSCGGFHLQKFGLKRTKTTQYQRYQCQSCGSISTTNMKDELPRSQ